MNITVNKTDTPKQKPDESNLQFGKIFTDHMFIMDYNPEQGWHDARIVPYGPLEYDPATAVFHYGQAIFEGMKAYATADGAIQLFRPEQNMQRINQSNDRICIPPIDEVFALEAVKTLVDLERQWVPKAEGTSLYIRPFIIATDAFLGLRVSQNYQFIVILSPVAAYYPQGINPVNIYVETEFVRAVRGGTGYAKTAGNYAASLKAQQKAAQKGYVQVLWLDGVEQKYVEEVGAMNVFFQIGDEVITPPLEGTILPGITRQSVMELLRSWDVKVSERKLSIDELHQAFQEGKLVEAFGTGTAAVISPIGELCWGSEIIKISKETGPLAKRLYTTLTGIQTGSLEDTFGWTVKV